MNQQKEVANHKQRHQAQQQFGPAPTGADLHQLQHPGSTGLHPNASASHTNNRHSAQQPQPQISNNSRGNTQLALNGKDLIIRMLAEVFQVNQLEDGQVKWQQVSSSLVPISLYSRTTGRWLEFLLAASGSNSMAAATASTTESAMSPDSRDFLILLQQFHQHQQQMEERAGSSMGLASNSTASLVVFQVIAHDYCNNQCKKILNSKIAQPGCRLGQASDYFVYWKEQRHCYTHHHHHNQQHYLHQHQHQVPPFAQSSFASSSGRRSRGAPPACCSQQQQQQQQWDTAGGQQTWGLNFASVNDAKLFYDICSLNLVDLNFNSEYLKQLASNDMRRELANKQSMFSLHQAHQLSLNEPPEVDQENNKKLIRDFLDYKQQRRTNTLLGNNSQQSMAGLGVGSGRQRNSENSIKRQLSNSSSKCQSCKRLLQQTTTTPLKYQSSSRETVGHLRMLMDERDQNHFGGSSTMRLRSRSSTRRQELADGNGHTHPSTDLKLKQARSFSTPASPERELLEQAVVAPAACPVHATTTRARHQSHNQQQQQQQQESSTDCESHHPRCLNFIRQQEQLESRNRKHLLNRQQLMAQQADQRPKKPIRGVLRDSTGSGSGDFPAPAVPVRQSSISSAKTKASPGAVSSNNAAGPAQQQMLASKSARSSGEYYASTAGGRKNQAQGNTQEPDDRQEMARFAGSKASQRRSTTAGAADQSGKLHAQFTDPDSSAAIAHRNARLARAQYANSKNMKEFLSLDAGGQQSACPGANQLAALNERFQQEHLQQANKQQSEQRHQAGADDDANRQRSSSKGALNEQSSTEAPTSVEIDGKTSAQSSVNEQQVDTSRRRTVTNSALAADGAVHNVSTTTDDLPLDPGTRRRMFKLTSEEVISERTEPRSLSTPSVAQPLEMPATLPTEQQNSGDFAADRQVRAVSLGPEVEHNWRGRRRGSNTGSRRRSLERTTCVDLMDNSPSGQLPSLQQPSGQDFKRTSYRLSPLDSTGHATAKERLNSTLPKIPLSSQQSAATYATKPKRQRTRSSGAAEHRHNDCCPALAGAYQMQESEDFLRQDPSCLQGIQCQEDSNQRLLSFKSMPDFNQLHHLHHYPGQLSTLQSHQNHWASPVQQHINHRGPLAATTTTRRVPLAGEFSNLSSYEVPANLGYPLEPHHHSTPSGGAYGRQSRSCPNSLRRKRRDHLHHQQQLHPAPIWANQRATGCYQPTPRLQNYGCPTCCTSLGPGASDRLEGSAEWANSPEWASSFHGCSLCMMATSAGSDGMAASLGHPGGFPRYTVRTRPLGAADDYHLDQCASMERRSARQAQHWQQQPRAHSSQSSRSPLRYGLYESDCDELDNDDEVDGDDGQNSGPSGPAVCCYGSGTELMAGKRSKSTHFNPGRPTQPVQGYDQTMARTALKSRQRARSQPPEVAGAEETNRLNKSMENVQKLISEVQNELSLMKSGAFWGNRWLMQGTTVDRANGSANKVSGANEQAPGVEMAQEENATTMRQQQPVRQQSTGIPGLASSATRRAGQFKCVGAIRKAGFLSVKKWILKRRQSIELARKQGWKRYWVCLRGTALLFHSVIDRPDDADGSARTDLLAWIRANCCAAGQSQLLASLMESGELVPCGAVQGHGQGQDPTSSARSTEALLKSLGQCYIEREPRHLIIIEGAIVQPIPEHPKRDHVFCLSTTFGDAYLFQASCQLESDNWISAIHNACAASMARDLTRDEAMKLFRARVRHLELEAEKKLFLRQRLESRLTTMSSIGGVGSLVDISADQQANDGSDDNNKLVTMRSLLQRLNQQLVALDTYLERVNCEIYQLRCYLSSCGAQQMFYQSLGAKQQQGSSPSLLAAGSIELPHPKSLLMHVSKPTKVMLIKLGVFTVSSFHAYIHARQGSADSILQRLQQQQVGGQTLLELRLGGTLRAEPQNRELETNTEQLIHLSNLRPVSIHLDKGLYRAIRRMNGQLDAQPADESVQESGQTVIINLRLHSSSNSASIIRQVLKILLGGAASKLELSYLNYYLRLRATSQDSQRTENADQHKQFFVAKRRETLADWLEFEYLELMEKVIFRVELVRRRLDEEEEAVAPFGISVGAQLLEGKLESQLNVYCSYIEWGSVADKAGLRDDDELLVINGVPVMDLDMMFVECIMQDEQSLRLVVRSSRSEYPTQAEPMDSWQRPASSEGGSGGGRTGEWAGDHGHQFHHFEAPQGGSQVISDKYIASLVCPPPPAKSDAFLRAPDSSLVRQKSDLGGAQNNSDLRDEQQSTNGKLVASRTSGSLAERQLYGSSKSHQDLSELDPLVDSGKQVQVNTDRLAGQLLRKTGQLNKLLREKSQEGDSQAGNDMKSESLGVSEKDASSTAKQLDPNCVERLRKSILELLETEYAYIRHLETISDHYLGPMEESSYLGIGDLRLLSKSVLGLIAFQRDFFDKLTTAIWAKCGANVSGSTKTRDSQGVSNKPQADESEELNKIVQQLELFKTADHFRPLILSLASSFVSEADRFKVYAAYCVAYSRLQKFLHPKRAHNASGSSSALIASGPTVLDTFVTSSGCVISGSHSAGPQSAGREFFKPLGSFMAAHSSIGGGPGMQTYSASSAGNSSELGAKLRQLGEFLANLDSSSSSASLSLPRSSNSENLTPASEQQQQQSQGSTDAAKRSPKSSSTSHQPPFQRSVHQQNFESYLIKPIQRIVKYPMLLSSIALSAQIYRDPELDQELQAAVKQMGTMASYVNDAQRIHDEFGSVFDQIERLYLAQLSAQQVEPPQRSSIATSPPISLTIEKLLYFGPVEWLNIGEFTQSSKLKQRSSNNQLSQMLFVFESCVVFICREQLKSSANGSSQQNSSSNKKKFSSIATGSGNGYTSNTTALEAPPPLGALSGASFKQNASQLQQQQQKPNFNHSYPIGDLQETSIIRYQSLIPVSEVQVRSVPTDSAAEPTNSATQQQFQWELFRCSSVNSNSSLLTKSSSKKSQTSGKVYLLSSPSNELRNNFLRKIRFIIRESVRNMSLPLARSPSSKSLSPKKMSSPSLATNTNSSCSTSLSPVCNSGAQCNKGRDGCEFPQKQVCPSSYKTSIEVNN